MAIAPEVYDLGGGEPRRVAHHHKRLKRHRPGHGYLHGEIATAVRKSARRQIRVTTGSGEEEESSLNEGLVAYYPFNGDAAG